VPHELSEYSLADIHPSLSAIATSSSVPAVLGSDSAWKKVQIEKSEIAPTQLISHKFLARKKI
jgi:hypothetical protein